MTRQPRETYVSPERYGFPKTSAVVMRRRIAAIIVAVLAAASIAVVMVIALVTSATGMPFDGSGAGANSPTTADAYPADGETGAIDLNDPISPFSIEHPAVARLDPALRDAIQAAASDAEAEGVSIELTSGWRSADYQASLLSNAIADYGSEEAAREFVSTPQASKHVTGEAIDIARVDPALWLEQYGNAYGLCRTFANESWHFELATTPGGECPAMLADASEAQ
ncbi:M15 family metallopeptidase [Leucobacter albus]|uniref:M15 family metallopeptidase n=1 Tax=Leucobacter albus TaxID=272210 RepID=A0ABW3TP84_9MICO